MKKTIHIEKLGNAIQREREKHILWRNEEISLNSISRNLQSIKEREERINNHNKVIYGIELVEEIIYNLSK